jgi:hypothetical protein
LSKKNNFKFGLAQHVLKQNAIDNLLLFAQLKCVLHESDMMHDIAQGDRSEPSCRMFIDSISDFF